MSGDEEFQEDPNEASEDDEPMEDDKGSDTDTEEDKGKQRKSGRAVKPINEPMYTSSATSTPGKTRKMKIKRGTNMMFQSRKRRTIGTGLSRKRTVGEPLKVAGKPLPGRETEFQEISSKLSIAVKSSQGLCLCTFPLLF